MYNYNAHDSSMPCEGYFESIFRFSHLLITGLDKGLTLNEAIFSTFSVEMHCYIVSDSSMSCEEYFESIFRFSHLLISG